MASTDKFAVGYTGSSDITGWLALFILWFALQVIIYSLAFIALRHRVGMLFFESLVFAGFAAIIGYLLLIKDKKGVLLAKVYLVVLLIIRLIELFQNVNIGKNALLRECLAIGTLILWSVYLVRSKRIKSIYFPAS